MSVQKELDQKIILLQHDELRRATKKYQERCVLLTNLKPFQQQAQSISEADRTAKVHAIHLRTVDKIARDIKKRAHMEGKFCKCRADLISQLTRAFFNVDLINKAIDDRVVK